MVTPSKASARMVPTRPAGEWSARFGIEVLDPDGWRADGTSWDTPITEVDFRRRAAESTISACAECGNDAPAEGYLLCTDCLEAGHQ